MITKHDLPIGVPCAVCTEMISDWSEVIEWDAKAIPCGHAASQIWKIWVQKVERRERADIDGW